MLVAGAGFEEGAGVCADEATTQVSPIRAATKSLFIFLKEYRSLSGYWTSSGGPSTDLAYDQPLGSAVSPATLPHIRMRLS